jgi:adenylate cyclase
VSVEGVAEILRELGVPEEAIKRGIERGDPEGAVLESALIPHREERTMSAADVEAAGGLSAAEIHETFQAMGLAPPPADEPSLTPDEARVFIELGALGDIWPRELRLQAARVYGRLLSRIARTGVELFRFYAEPRLQERSESLGDHLLALREAFERLLAIPDPLLVGVHRRWLEYELTQTGVSAAQSREPGLELPGAVDVTLLFCDLKDFTAYANSQGDAAAVEAIDVFAHTVYAERGAEGRLVKALGDGHMLAYPDATPAVAAGARIIAAMSARDALGVHVSVHRGVAISREGDYFGTAVNLAARLLGLAGHNELVATAATIEASDPEFQWEPIGAHTIRGVDDPVEVFRLRSEALV